MKTILLTFAALVLAGSLFAFSSAGPEKKKSTSSSQTKQAKESGQSSGVAPEAKQKQTTETPSSKPDEYDAYLNKLLAKEIALPEHYRAQLDAEVKIRKALSRRMDFGFLKMPLKDVIEFFRQELELNIRMDAIAIEEVGGDLHEEVTFTATDIMARSTLNGIFRSLHVPLTWLVEDEMLWITTVEKADTILTTKFYNVTDLALVRIDQNEYHFEYNALRELIKAGCNHDALWEEDDGEGGTISTIDRPGIRSLVIRQTHQVHEEIEVILAGLRNLRRKEPEFFKTIRSAISESFEEDQGEKRSANCIPLFANPMRDQLVRSHNRFAFDLYGLLRKGESKNLFFSPYGIVEALGMVYAGARGETAEEIQQALHYDLTANEIHQAFRLLRETTVGNYKCGTHEMTIANRLWGDSGFPVRDSYQELARKHYNAELETIDFQQSEIAAQKVNTWMAEQTRDKIKKIAFEDDFKSTTRLILTNAIYFKGKWKDPFEKGDTKPDDFFINEETIRVQLMYQQSSFRYLRGEQQQILELPYQGESMSMFLVLPQEKTTEALETIEASLDPQKLDTWLEGISRRKVDVYLPKFRFETGYRLIDPLAELGMPSLFDMSRADLSGISPIKPGWIETVRHKAYIEVDEEGTEAAAVTLVGGGFGGFAKEPPIPVFRADHPFLFLIRDNRTKNILFLGRVINPLAN